MRSLLCYAREAQIVHDSVEKRSVCGWLLCSPQPVEWINRRPTSSNFKMKMRRQCGISRADCSDNLTLRYMRTFRNRHSLERAVHRIVAAAVLEDDSVSISAHYVRENNCAGRHRMNLRSLSGSDPDSIPTSSRVVGIDHSAKPVEDVSLDWPVQLPKIGCSNRAWRCRRTAGS